MVRRGDIPAARLEQLGATSPWGAVLLFIADPFSPPSHWGMHITRSHSTMLSGVVRQIDSRLILDADR